MAPFHLQAVLVGALVALGPPVALAEEAPDEKAEWKERLERQEQEIRRHVEAGREEIGRILDEARGAAERGDRDAARDLEARAMERKERLALEVREMVAGLEEKSRRGREEMGIGEIERQLEKLTREARAAAERGEGDRAQKLDREAAAIREKIDARRREREAGSDREARGEAERGEMREMEERREAERREMEERRGEDRRVELEHEREKAVGRIHDLEQKLVELKEEMQAAARRGERERAEVLEEKTHAVRREMEEIRRGLEAMERMEQLERAQHRPQRPWAPEPRSEPRPEEDRYGPRDRPMGPPLEEIEALRREIRGLREQLERIEGILRRLEARGPMEGPTPRR